ncbi:MAG: hypothetical protein ACQEXB_18350 [Bacillota bacterium]
MNKIKKWINWFYRVCLAIFVFFFFIFLFIALLVPGLINDSQTVNTIAIIGLIISFPSIASQLAQEVNPKKKTYKLSAQCPKCRYLIQMDMKEE